MNRPSINQGTSHHVNRTISIVAALAWGMVLLPATARAEKQVPWPNAVYCSGGACCAAPANQTACCNDVLTVSDDEGGNSSLSPEDAGIRLGSLGGSQADSAMACVYQGTGTCSGQQSCCLPNGTCTMADGRCCDDLGGIAGAAGSTCGTTMCGACCTGTTYPYSCAVKPSSACTGTASGFAGAGTTCAAGTCTTAYACCYPDHLVNDPEHDRLCDNQALSICDSENGTPYFGTTCEADDPDLDGVPGFCDDNCPLVPNLDQANFDGDQFGDACDPCIYDGLNDVDGDTICGDADNCPVDANTDQLDSDGDGAGDVCDLPCPFDADNDADGDGLCADVDNCPTMPNPGQENCDDWSGDTQGDACDSDIDGDGIPNTDDACDYTPYPYIQLNLVVLDAANSLYGTVRWDVDGDCDVDEDDIYWVTVYGSSAGCGDGGNHLEYKLCP